MSVNLVFVVSQIVTLLALALVVVALVRRRRRQDESERNLALLLAELSTRREAIDAARRMRHDSRHHRMVLSDFLLRGKVDQALSYLEQLDAAAERNPTDKFVWCENETVNAILSGFARLAKSKGIELEVTANVERQLPVQDVDIVSVLANQLENALNATEKSGAGGTVVVSLRQRERTFGVAVENRVSDGFRLSARGLPCAEKGTGLKSIFEIVSRYRGECVYSLADGRVTCQVVLKLAEGERP